jgi:hypothetical protein
MPLFVSGGGRLGGVLGRRAWPGVGGLELVDQRIGLGTSLWWGEKILV